MQQLGLIYSNQSLLFWEINVFCHRGPSSWKPWRLRRCVVSTWLHAYIDCDGYHAMYGSPSHIWWTTTVFTLRTLMFIQSPLLWKPLRETVCLVAEWGHVNSYAIRTVPAGVSSSFLRPKLDPLWSPSTYTLELQLSSLTCVVRALFQRQGFSSKGKTFCSTAYLAE